MNMEFDTRTLASSAYLIHVEMKAPSNTKRDRRKTEEVQLQEDTKHVRVNKTPWAGTILKDIISLHSKVRRKLTTTYTTPWDNLGYRLLPMTNEDECMKYLNEQEKKHDELVQKFRKELPKVLEKQKKKLGSLFDPSDYPDINSEWAMDKFMYKFGFEIFTQKLPDSGHVVVDIESKVLNEKDKRFAKTLEKRLKTGIEAMLLEGHEILRQWHKVPNKERMYKTTGRENAETWIKKVESCNLSNDPRLNSLKKDVKEIVGQVDMKRLCDDMVGDEARLELSDQAKKVMDKFNIDI